MLFDAMQRGVKRPFFHTQRVLRHLLDVHRDPVAVLRTAGERFQNQEIEGALHYTGIGFPHLTSLLDNYESTREDVDCQEKSRAITETTDVRVIRARTRNRPKHAFPVRSNTKKCSSRCASFKAPPLLQCGVAISIRHAGIRARADAESCRARVV